MTWRMKMPLKILTGVLAFLLLAVLAAMLTVRSDWFGEKLRERIIVEVEKATGGKAEIGAFSFDWRSLRAEVRNLTIHGTEPDSYPPLFRAESVAIGLRIVSAFRRDIDIELLELHRLEVSIEVDADGKTNFPERPARSQAEQNPVEPLLDLAVKRLTITGGIFRYASRTVPFDLSGENLEARSSYEAAGPRYRGQLAMKRIQIDSPDTIPLVFDSDLEWILDRDRITIQRARLEMEKSRVELSGGITNIKAPNASFDVRASLAIEELAAPLQLPLLPRGTLELTGDTNIDSAGYRANAVMKAEGLGFKQGQVQITGISASSQIAASPEAIRLNALTVAALDGGFTGEAVVEQLRNFRIDGRLRNLSIQKLAPRLQAENIVWSGIVSGPLQLQGELPGGSEPGLAGNGQFTVLPTSGGLPLEGSLDIKFSQPDGRVEFGPSYMAWLSSRVDFSGVLGEEILTGVTTEDLDDLLPVIKLSGKQPPETLPVRLRQSEASFEGLVSGLPGDPNVVGDLSLGPFLFRDHTVDRLAAHLEYSGSRLQLANFSILQNQARLRGDIEVGLQDGVISDDSVLGGEISLTGASVSRILRDIDNDLPIDGALSGAAKLTGTVSSPRLLASMNVDAVSAYGEKFNQLRAEVRYSTDLLEVISGRIEAAPGIIAFRGAYEHAAGIWENGRLRFDLSGEALHMAQFSAIEEYRAGLDARLDWRLSGSAEVSDRSPRLTSLTGEASILDLAFDDKRLGSVRLNAGTSRNVLAIRGSAGLIDAKLTINAEWSLARNSFGLGQIAFTGLTLNGLREVGLLGGTDVQSYADGVMDGEIGFSGPILEPATWTGMAKVTRMVVTPRTEQKGENSRDLTLRNAGPLQFAINSERISIQTARMISEDTDLNATGTLSFRRRNPWNLHLKGSLDLAALDAVKPDLMARGKSTMDVLVRGSLLEPQVNGRLEFENASFHLRELPNGLENANGAILFDRTRATVEKFSSRTGGGDLALAGFIGFGGEELIYRLQAQARKVRVRYPEGVSTLLNANLDFIGTSTRSTLSGEVTVTRAAFNPGTDIGGVLAETTRQASRAEITNPFLRGMQFDIRVSTGASAEFLTSLTRDIELEADLQLRGGPAKPILLGRVAVHRGEIQFFGNKYSIVQGEITFYNPVKIEPVLAMDLETRVRGYTVMLNFTGVLDKLNFSYRSDPPLQSREILALLTVGRAPQYARSGSGGQSASGQSFLQAGGNSLLGQALAAPVTSRLQRFFGVSRIKIDPQLTGVDNTPETHITVEQQLSREITLTYVTNLARTQQQIVRVEWNLSQDWSLYAVRDSNGVFGVDFMYRRLFK